MDNFIILLIIICILISIIYCSVLFCSLSISIIHCSDDDNCSDLKGLLGDGTSSEYWDWEGGGQEGEEGEPTETCSIPGRRRVISSCSDAKLAHIIHPDGTTEDACARDCGKCYSRDGYICALNGSVENLFTQACRNDRRCSL